MNKIILDGEVYDVVLNIRDKGKKQYQYLIEFHPLGSATEIRRQIRRVVDDMNSRIQHPTAAKYIPANLTRAIVDLMETIDTTTTINKDGTVRELGKTAREKIATLNTLYDNLKNDPTYSEAYDPQVKEWITKLAEDIGDTPVNNMSRAQLEETLNTLKAIRQTARDSVKITNDNFKKNVRETGRELIRETNAANPIFNGKASDFLNWQLSPDRFFERLGGFQKNSEWSNVGKMFSEATEKSLEVERDFYNTFREFTENKEFKTLGDIRELVDIGLKDNKGKPVKVTRGMMLSVYMHLLSEDNRRGLAASYMSLCLNIL